MKMRRIITLAACFVVAFFMIAGSCKKVPKVPVKPFGVATTYKYATENYGTMTTDPGNNQVKCVFDWGDGKFDTTDLGNSGESLYAPHTWLTEGTFARSRRWRSMRRVRCPRAGPTRCRL